MLSVLYYFIVFLICSVLMIVSVVALVVCYPFDKGRVVVHELTRAAVRVFFALPPCWRHRLIGRELADPRKSYVIVLNHNAMIDIPSLYYVPLNFRWVSKREVFRIPFFGQFLLIHGDICIDRGKASEAMEQLLRDGKLWLSRGASVAVFPEGTRSKDGEIHRFKAGAFTLAKEAGVEILPVVLDGTQTLIKPNRLWNWRNTITIRVLPPVPVGEVRSTELHDLIDSVHTRMSEALSEIRQQK